MNEEEIRDEARKAADRSQFMSNHIYDHKSYEDGFYEGMNQALRLGVTEKANYEIQKLFDKAIKEAVTEALRKHFVGNRRELFDKFYEWLDGLSQAEYDDMSLTDKCEKFFFKT